ncbi:MAG TPA: type II toxin-antitoxin system Phd/YefM family antitoxin [Actinomycetales bacterium]|nr:type II toxin-antitoxin system Phd/YefM family antitoxin [Actinomycetales bacterium]
MTTVGIRDFRDGLSRHLERVREGETITVTDHGKPVARVVPVGVPTRLEQMIAAGLVTPAKKPKVPLRPPIRVAGTVSDLVMQQRR